MDDGQESRPGYVLRLYVTGATARSSAAIQNLRSILEEYVPGGYDLEVIDVYQHPAVLREEQLLVAPTLIKELPAPARRLIGDLSNTERVIVGLDLRRRA
jgi:circadian clock protein KaiB